jgi:hypothetical protein
MVKVNWVSLTGNRVAVSAGRSRSPKGEQILPKQIFQTGVGGAKREVQFERSVAQSPPFLPSD